MMLETELFRLEPDITVLSCAGKFTMGTRLKQTEALEPMKIVPPTLFQTMEKDGAPKARTLTKSATRR